MFLVFPGFTQVQKGSYQFEKGIDFEYIIKRERKYKRLLRTLLNPSRFCKW